MEMREKRLVDEVVGYVCDICGSPCLKESGSNRLESSEHATLRADWGYWSEGKDETAHECHMCESCYDKVRRFIEDELKGKVRVLDRALESQQHQRGEGLRQAFGACKEEADDLDNYLAWNRQQRKIDRPAP
jgi:hypothetical protein